MTRRESSQASQTGAVVGPRRRVEIESSLCADRAALWAWITDLRCLRREMMPWLRMTGPPGISRLTDLPIAVGTPMFSSVILLFGVVPIDVSRLTLAAFTDGEGFVERSPMLTMRSWTHARTILAHPERADASILRDAVSFEARLADAPTAWFVARIFAHRHRVLRRVFGDC